MAGHGHGAGATELCSPAYAACHAGTGYYRALIAQLEAEFSQPFTLCVCCGDDPAIAHEALRLGLQHIRYQGSARMLEQLRAIAAELGAVVESVP